VISVIRAVVFYLIYNNNNNICHLADAFIQSDLQSCVHTFYVWVVQGGQWGAVHSFPGPRSNIGGVENCGYISYFSSAKEYGGMLSISGQFIGSARNRPLWLRLHRQPNSDLLPNKWKIIRSGLPV
jgi:hypothetical protein